MNWPLPFAFLVASTALLQPGSSQPTTGGEHAAVRPWLDRLARLPDAPIALSAPTGAKRCTQRRHLVAREMGEGLLILEAGESSDGRFRAADDFHWLTGVAVPGAILVLEASAGRLARERLYLPAFDARHELWNGPRLAPGSAASTATGIADTRPLSQFEFDAHTLVTEADRVAGSGPRAHSVSAAAGVKLERERQWFKDPQSVKDAGEIAAVRAAVDITQASLAEAFAVAVPGAWEFTVEAVVEAGFRRRGAQGPAFSSICGSGPNTCYLHYRDNQRQLEAGDLLIVDVGAKFQYYCSDLTRTIPVNGKFTPRQREIYEVVYEASRMAASLLKPGAKMREVHLATEKFLAKRGFDRNYFPHSVGHGVGLRVHDFPWKEDVLRPGMIVTIEPGLYLPKESLGIRIEDDYLITAEGAELLSDDLPSHPDDIEALLAALRE